MSAREDIFDQFYRHLSSGQQSWLLGAGVSMNAGIPLMYPLTDRVREDIAGTEDADLYEAIRESLKEDSHIEQVLSQLGDLTALAERSRNQSTRIGNDGAEYDCTELQRLHAKIRDCIGDIVRYGSRVEQPGGDVIRGTRQNPIVSIDDHRTFVDAVFQRSRAGLEAHRPPVKFFTTNYDTLIEDSLALAQIPYFDGFTGGATAFWSGDFGNPPSSSSKACVYKLHGSIDWYSANQTILRCRDNSQYPSREGNLLIYPQATKYAATRDDPFSVIFDHFRYEIESNTVLCVCGYSFGDEHINLIIERAMNKNQNETILLLFAKEIMYENGETNIPDRIRSWLSEWKKRVFVLTDRGFYNRNQINLCESVPDNPYDWWKFQGMPALFHGGLQRMLEEVAA